MLATHTEHFVDRDFPPCRASLGQLDSGRNQHRQSRAAAISWARAQDLDARRSRQGLAWHVFNGDPRPSDVSQGMLGDCWLISALAVLAERPQLLRDIMISDRLNDRGAYGVKLCKDGVWQSVIIDDYFPCSSGTLAFSEARRGALWVALIEKAYAKLHGSYAAIESGRITEALSTLTGAACETERLQLLSNDDGPPVDTELLWAKVVAGQGKGFLMGVSSLSKSQSDPSGSQPNQT
jgi:calpain-15|eukprot:COSAG02_NODE_78_length_40609_cov_19.893730_12_plen_237_part_00